MDVFGRLVARVGATSPSSARPRLPHRFEERSAGPFDLAETTVEQPAADRSAADRRPAETPAVGPAVPLPPARPDHPRTLHDAPIVVTPTGPAAAPPLPPDITVAPPAPRPVPHVVAPALAAPATTATETVDPPRARPPGPHPAPDPLPSPPSAARPAPERPVTPGGVTPLRDREVVAAAPVTAGPHRVPARPVTAAPARSVPRPAAAAPTVVVTIGRVDIRPPRAAAPVPAPAAPAAVAPVAPVRLTLHEYLRGTGTSS